MSNVEAGYFGVRYSHFIGCPFFMRTLKSIGLNFLIYIPVGESYFGRSLAKQFLIRVKGPKWNQRRQECQRGFPESPPVFCVGEDKEDDIGDE